MTSFWQPYVSFIANALFLQHTQSVTVPNGSRGNPPPQLTLKGRWLEDLGFNTGQPVIVTVEHGRLVIEEEIRF
ncbi:Domain of unknown function DUF1813 HSP20-like protein [Dickeya parazeae Ech586]|uniref:Toxin SymE-like domain-containing protein n=1 Tax=Dickeya zeae (strain Ech586) TaxID=590409 RepID=D2BYY7_DICZ5|nr:Domain of unknown function DUF1813 HSP20-like protein [Dickeya parazeae Ech586]MBP2837056.1 type I toxin-antitoxin system SymE family toxin [Dickeya parazeae]